MNLVDVVILGLATWRISSLLVDERGPFNVFVKIRSMAGITHDENGEAVEFPDGFFPQLLSCIWCLSVWTGLFVAVAYLLSPNIAILVLFPFALSATAILVNRAL